MQSCFCYNAIAWRYSAPETLACSGSRLTHTRLSECGGLELLSKAVAYHTENAELQAAGCGAIRLLCAGHPLAPRNRRVFTERLGGADAVAAAMRCHRMDTEVQREACGAIHAASAGHPPGARRFVSSDGIALCLEAITSCADEAVGAASCRALQAMQCASDAGLIATDAVAEDVEAVWEAKLRAERERGLAFCMDALQQHLPRGERAQEGLHPGGDRVVLPAVLDAAGIFLTDSGLRHRALALAELIVSSMQHLANGRNGNMNAQTSACKLLSQLMDGHLYKEEAVAQVAACGGAAAVCQDAPCNADLQMAAVCALRHVACGDDGHKTMAVRAGAIPAVLMAMRRYPKEVQLQELALGSLGGLCDTVGRAQMCAKQGGIEVIIAALKRHAAVGRIAELGCVLLCMFCDDAQVRRQVIRSGAEPVAKELCRMVKTEVQRWGWELLHDLNDDA